ncbi:MAG: hypothetical protein HY553_09900 [Elusimicrobia bacterium]|nr:hypothetical protein [Elusimicrobiota bacterium]
MTRACGVLVAAALGAGCGADVAFDRASARERKGVYAEAAERFAAFADRYRSDPRVPEALVRSARLYTYRLQRCPQAQPLLERAAREHESSPWAEEARRALLDCPEYFPMRPRSSWVFVDSQTGGKNMRLEVLVTTSTASSAELKGAFFAGTKRFQEFRRRYVKEGWAVWEEDGADRVPILRYPYREGNAWKARRGGRPVEFRIESSKETVRVKAGVFHGCLKVREAQLGVPAWKYDYYAPGVGRVKTTIGGRGFENPNTELRDARAPS